MNFLSRKSTLSSIAGLACILGCVMVLAGCKNTLISSAHAKDNQDQNLTSAYDCTQVSLEDIDESLLTREERLALLDGSLSDSIDAYSSCVSTVQENMASAAGQTAGGASAGSAGEGAQASAGQNASDEQMSSVTNGQQSQNSQNAQGEAADEFESGGMQAGSEPVANSSSSTTEVQRGIVAPKDNDSIICKLLFAEIEKAQGSAKSGLEKQYKEYQCGE